MGALFDIAKQIEPWLIERGLSREDIASGMKILFGEDWANISALVLFERLRTRGFYISRSLPEFTDELEGLIRGTLILRGYQRNYHKRLVG